jgi:hypothetical protein
MLYGYELVAFATRLIDFWHPHGFFRCGLLGMRGACEIASGFLLPLCFEGSCQSIACYRGRPVLLDVLDHQFGAGCVRDIGF